jgi:hypothetical protein
VYKRLHEQEIELQNTVLKSSAEQIALANYKLGLSETPGDIAKASEVLDKLNQEAKEPEYPRTKGPIPPQSYETLYCANEITEMSDGNTKRSVGRVYDSPFSQQQNRFEPLRADLEAIQAYNQKLRKDQADRENMQNKAEEEYRKNLPKGEFGMNDDAPRVARRELGKASQIQQENQLRSSYSASYTPYKYTSQVNCPPNEYYKNISYTQNPAASARINNEAVPRNLTALQDGWSKSLATKRFHSAYETRMKDLRDNNFTGKKIVKDSPMNAYRYV